jgi:His/Glu/Gln/Arg/opine family amino acid ABC transporter permease subunit
MGAFSALSSFGGWATSRALGMYNFNLQEIYPFLGKLFPAILNTLSLTAIAIFLSMILGVGLALMRRSENRTPRAIGTLYVEIIRNMPIIVLVYLIYFGLPELGWRPSGFICAIIAMTLNSAAFMTEIFRAGLVAIPKGQYEASRSQGMTWWQMFRLVIFPQILRVAYAPLGNQLIGVIMASSIASVITVEEVTAWMVDTGAITYRYFETFAIAALVYLILCQATNFGRVAVGRYLFRNSAGGQW